MRQALLAATITSKASTININCPNMPLPHANAANHPKKWDQPAKTFDLQKKRKQKNNTRDPNMFSHRRTNLARLCLTLLSRREAVLSLWYDLS
jgi:hypothetical protein